MIEIIPNLHPAFVHFPIAFATAAVAFIAVGTLFKSWSYATQCLVTGRWMLWGTALFALIAAVFGWFAFNSVTHDEASHTAMILHRNWALGTLTALLALAAWDVWRWHFGRMPSPGFLGLLVAAWLLVMSTAWHGAELVYRHGLGVMALPDVHDEQNTLPHDNGEHGHVHAH
ncbi:MAG: DUF2231 domain-containing protein [Gallionella sp.]|nr:DUF2231 domain-containing protein [Gallionella sp.]